MHPNSDTNHPCSNKLCSEGADRVQEQIQSPVLHHRFLKHLLQLKTLKESFVSHLDPGPVIFVFY